MSRVADSLSSPNSNCDLDEQKLESSSALPSTDPSFSRRFFIARDEILTKKHDSDGVIALRHPNSLQRAIYYTKNAYEGEPELFELLKVERTHTGGSFFFGDGVIEDGSLTLLSPIHPLFLCIPYLLKWDIKEHSSLEQLLDDEEFPAIHLLRRSTKLSRALGVACSTRVEGGRTIYAYDEARLLNWLASKFDALKTSLLKHESHAMEEVKENDDFLSRRALCILHAFIPNELHKPLNERLNLASIGDTDDPSGEVGSEAKPTRGKRRKNAGPFEGTCEKVGRNDRRKKISKDLAVASKGTKTLTAFFVKK